LINRQLVFLEFPDGNGWTVNCHRGNDCVHAGAIREAGIHGGAFLVNTPPQGEDNFLDDADDCLIIIEGNIGFLDFSIPLNIDGFASVHHHFADFRIVQKRLEGTKSHQVIHDVVEKLVTYRGGEGETQAVVCLLHDLLDGSPSIGCHDGTRFQFTRNQV